MRDIRGKRILIVEDEFFIAMMAAQMLEELGAVVIGPASTVDQAMALAETESIDIGLLDINLHGDNSAPIAAALDARRIPVVFATGYGKGDDTDSKGHRVVGKPYTQEKLVTQLCCALAETAAAGRR